MIFTDNQVTKRINALCLRDGSDDKRSLYESFFKRHQDYWRAVETNKPHDNWLKIQSYEADLAQYQIDMDAFANWNGEGEQPVEPDYVPKPQGYYTQEEVDSSQVAYDEWLVARDAYVPMEGESYPVPAPVVLLRPVDILEPTVTPLPDPVPNDPEPEFTQAELEEARIANIKGIAMEKILSVMDENSQRNSLADIGRINGIVEANRTAEDVDLLEVHLYNWATIEAIRAESNQAEVDGTEPIDIVWSI